MSHDPTHAQRVLLDAYVRQHGLAASWAAWIDPTKRAARVRAVDHDTLTEAMAGPYASRGVDVHVPTASDLAAHLGDSQSTLAYHGYTITAPGARRPTAVDGRDTSVTLPDTQVTRQVQRAARRTLAVPHAHVDTATQLQARVEYPSGWTADTRREPATFAVSADGTVWTDATSGHREPRETYEARTARQVNAANGAKPRPGARVNADAPMTAAERKRRQRARAKAAELAVAAAEFQAELANARADAADRRALASAVAQGSASWDENVSR